MKKKTVLIVEDSPGFSELMKFVVEDEGFNGVLFPLEENFMQWVEKEKPAAIIMDLALNRLSGFDLIRVERERRTRRVGELRGFDNLLIGAPVPRACGHAPTRKSLPLGRARRADRY